MKKISLKLNGYKRHKEIEQEMIHNNFLIKYGVGGNKWISDNRVRFVSDFGSFVELFEDRHLWIPIYLDHHFWVRMRITQRSESMHTFFNKFITRNSSLIQFVKQYDNYQGSREQREREFDAANFHTSALGFTAYEVVEQVSNLTFNKFVVTYDAISCEVKCQCLLFYSRGILCYHSLSALSFEQSKNVKRRHTHIKNSQDEPLSETRNKRFDYLVFFSHNICEFATSSKEYTVILHHAFDNVMAEMQEYQVKSKDGGSMIQSSSNLYMNYPGKDMTHYDRKAK
ncbi:hypothetical protein Ahy_A05g022699 [Arachis hypogaea]|uniref:Protein FAR1-RELATED SEQUENCE n=1 Tax=Arachis hypogaea TaxID=3818 RepID=A0A445D1C3_ARAHY|nr:hypothetical protein Ahy_A05g022699 [Arachis hypogaea]